MNNQLILATTESKNLFEQINFIEIAAIMLNVLILFVGLTFLLYKPVKKFIASRREEVARITAENQTLQQTVKETKENYNIQIEKAHAESTRITNEALKMAEDTRREILVSARDEGAKIISRAHKEAEKEKMKMENEIKDMVADISTKLCESILEEKVSKDIDEKLIDKYIKEYEDTIK